jgi:Flp pilus assembly protein TadG
MNSSKDRPSASNTSGARRGQSGQSLLELALMTPVLLAMLIGVIEFGRYVYIGSLVANAARAGAGYGAQSLAQAADTAGITAAADSDFQNNGQNVNKLTVNRSFVCGCDSSGTVTTSACTGATAGKCASGHWVVMLSVEAKGTFNSIFSFPGIPASLDLDRTVTLRVNQN